jgi:hypothetical protein
MGCDYRVSPLEERKTMSPPYDRVRVQTLRSRALRPDEGRHIDASLIGLRLVALLEQLAAMRLDLVHGILPRAERTSLTRGDLDYLLVQLDAAIAAGRGIAASLGPPPTTAHTAEDSWRSEDTKVNAREVT